MSARDPQAGEYRLRIGTITLDRARRSVERDGRPVAVEPRIFDLLWYLGHKVGRVCSKSELLDAVWPDRVVSESTLYRAIAIARGLLGDERPPRIRTVHARGYELIGPVERLPGSSTPTRSPGRRKVGGLLAASLLTAALALVAAWLLRNETPPQAGTDHLALEMGEFRAETPAAEFPGEALWNELGSELSRLKALRVIDERGRENPGQRRLRGRWRIDGQDLVTHAELLEMPSERLLWSANFRQPMGAADRLRHEMAAGVTRALGLESVNRAGESLPLPVSGEDGGYARYLRARSLWRTRQPDALLEASALLQAVIRDQPRLARAHEALASVYVVMPDWLDVDADATRALAWASAREALRLESRLGEARGVLAQQAIRQGRWLEAEALFRQGLEREPGNATLRHWYAEFLLRVGHLQRARVQSDRAIELDSVSAMPRAVAAWIALLQGRNDRAAEIAGEAVALGLPALALVQAWADARRGRVEPAAERLGELPNATAALAECASALSDPSRRSAAWQRLKLERRSDELADIYNLACRAMLGGPELAEDPDIPPSDSSAFGLLWSREFAPVKTGPVFLARAEADGLVNYWRRLGAPDGCRLQDRQLVCETTRDPLNNSARSAFQSEKPHLARRPVAPAQSDSEVP